QEDRAVQELHESARRARTLHARMHKRRKGDRLPHCHGICGTRQSHLRSPNIHQDAEHDILVRHYNIRGGVVVQVPNSNRTWKLRTYEIVLRCLEGAVSFTQQYAEATWLIRIHSHHILLVVAVEASRGDGVRGGAGDDVHMIRKGSIALAQQHTDLEGLATRGQIQITIIVKVS